MEARRDPKDRPASELSIAEVLALVVQREAETDPLGDMTAMELSGERLGAKFKVEVLKSRIERLPSRTTRRSHARRAVDPCR